MKDSNLEVQHKELSRLCIEQLVPAEVPFFDTIWDIIRQRIFFEGLPLPPEEWPSPAKDPGLMSGLGVHGGEHELKTPIIILALNAIAIAWLSSQDHSKRVLDELTEKYISEFKTPPWTIPHIKALVLGQAPESPAVTKLEKSPEKPSLESSEERLYFSLLTEKGSREGNEQEYMDLYADGPTQPGFHIWVDRISEREWVKVGKGEYKQLNLTGDKLKLLILLLRKFNQQIDMEELYTLTKHHRQALSQLHNVTNKVLDPFLTKKWSDYQKLLPFSKYNKNIRFSFCLIEPYKNPVSK